MDSELQPEGGYQADLSADLSVFLNVSLDSENVTSTPKTVRPSKSALQRPTRRSLISPFKKPVSSQSSRQRGRVIATCVKCGAEYCTLKYYIRHMQGHKLKEFATRAPDVDSIKENYLEIGLEVLEVMSVKPQVYGLIGNKFSALLKDIAVKTCSEEWKEFMLFLVQEFCILLCGEKYSMPSSLICTSLKVADDILTSFTSRNFLSTRLCGIVICDQEIIDSFICEFVMVFADHLIIFTFRCLRNGEETSAGEKDVVFNLEQRQAIFYIGGSIFHGFRKLGVRYSKSKKWQAIVEVINSKILEDNLHNNLSQQQKDDRQWTEGRNRGGLKFVNSNVQKFLLSVAKIIVQEQQSDGSLPIEEILMRVVVLSPKLEWDRAVGTSLDQDLSLTLMIGVAKSLISTYGKGLIKKFMNEENNNRATVSLTLRHKVAPH